MVAAEHSATHVNVSPPARLAVTKALTAVQPDHPELEAARGAGIPIEAWQQVVADAAETHGGRLVALAGTHGKSTSAGWLVHMLVEADRDPAAFVGALLPKSLTGAEPATARWGSGGAFVVEADEYAGNFDPYRPSLAVVLNAEWDHPDVFADQAAVIDTFEDWLRAPGAAEREAVLNVGDAGGAKLAWRLRDWGARVHAVAPMSSAEAETSVRYELVGRSLRLEGLPLVSAEVVQAELALPGAHNAANAACVAVAAALLGLSAAEIVGGLSSFGGVGRRFDVKGEHGGVLLIDDYGHHPSAIRSTVAAVRDRFPGRPIWLAHEPLTYHRAAAMLDELAAAIATADHAVVADIWAGRDPDTSITSAAALAEAAGRVSGDQIAATGTVESTADYLAERVRPGDIVLVMGGGRSYVIADRLVALLDRAVPE
jgi:UDP-N-acetylmuramate--alanine ligase